MTALSYKGYPAVLTFDPEDELFHGEVAGLRDVITFHGRSVTELKKALKESVDTYLSQCKSRGEEPDKPFSGHFMVRTTPDDHRMAVLAARSKGLSLNAWVAGVLREAAGQAFLRPLGEGRSNMAEADTGSRAEGLDE